MPILKQLLRQMGTVLREKPWAWTALAVLALLGLWALAGLDEALTRQAQQLQQHDLVYSWAKTFSRYGRVWPGVIVFQALAALVARLTAWADWRRVLLAGVVAVCLAGTETNALRWSLGRPRPRTWEEGLRGPTVNHRYASFPSAHATCAFAVAVPVVVLLPGLGVPGLVLAVGVALSRWILLAHYATDIWAGAWLGTLNGLVVALAVQRLNAGSIPGAGPKNLAPD